MNVNLIAPGAILFLIFLNTFSLNAQTKKYNINGVSIAVIHNYQIEGASRYGLADVSGKLVKQS